MIPLNPYVIRTIDRAKELAREMGKWTVSTEHLLLALLEPDILDQTAAQTVFHKYEIDIERLASLVRAGCQPLGRTPIPPEAEMSMSIRVQTVVDITRLAQWDPTGEVGTGHLLVAILVEYNDHRDKADQGSLAGRELTRFGLTLKKLAMSGYDAPRELNRIVAAA